MLSNCLKFIFNWSFFVLSAKAKLIMPLRKRLFKSIIMHFVLKQLFLFPFIFITLHPNIMPYAPSLFLSATFTLNPLSLRHIKNKNECLLN